MKLLLINHSEVSMPRAYLKKWVSGVARELSPRFKKIKNKELVIVFVSKSDMKRLNGQYRDRHYATDVLSFDAADEDSLGELVICPKVVYKQSQNTGLSRQGELGYMILHGVLHLLGFDHEKSLKEAEKMFALQDKVFAALKGK